MPFKKRLILIAILFFSFFAFAKKDVISIGSKRFTENYLLAEIFSQYLESQGHTIKRRFGLGGTMVAFNALQKQEIDIYPEYTGTIARVILQKENQNFDQLNKDLIPKNTQMLAPLGFDNSYCVIMKKNQANSLNIKTISDLTQHPKLKGAFSAEFLVRGDGWTQLKEQYQLTNSVLSVEVPLNYEALANSKVDFTEAYSTEPLILKNNFLILKDNKSFFPKYAAVPLVHRELSPKIIAQINQLSKRLSNKRMTQLNQRATKNESIASVANSFLFQEGLIKSKKFVNSSRFSWARLAKQTKTHLILTGLAVLFATFCAVPLGVLISNRRHLSRFVLGLTGVFQTIPSIALLTFMIPLFGIGFKPAVVGLFVYSLLPILRNTHTALLSIDPRLITAARGIGLYPFEIFFSVTLPLAFPTILAGIRTATILNIGTATLAAFIGAGGLGEPIVSGLSLNDSWQVLHGAIPAALLALLVDFLFGLIDKFFTRNI